MRFEPRLTWALAAVLLSGAVGVPPARAQYGAGAGGYGGASVPSGPSFDPSNFIAGMEARRQAQAKRAAARKAQPRRAASPDSRKGSAPRAVGASGAERSAAQKADQLMRLGKALEDRGQKAQAARYYREVVEKHAGAPQAKQAAERIKALK
jgi:hypothetical protein